MAVEIGSKLSFLMFRVLADSKPFFYLLSLTTYKNQHAYNGSFKVKLFSRPTTVNKLANKQIPVLCILILFFHVKVSTCQVILLNNFDYLNAYSKS